MGESHASTPNGAKNSRNLEYTEMGETARFVVAREGEITGSQLKESGRKVQREQAMSSIRKDVMSPKFQFPVPRQADALRCLWVGQRGIKWATARAEEPGVDKDIASGH